jgi:hypothetical protein
MRILGNLIIMLLLTPLLPAGDQGQLTGTVTESAGSPVAGLTVKLLPPKEAGYRELITSTDNSGSYIFRTVPSGKYLIELYQGLTLVHRELISVSGQARADVKLTKTGVAQIGTPPLQIARIQHMPAPAPPPNSMTISPAAIPAAKPPAQLQRGDQGATVERLHARLWELGYYRGSPGARYTAATEQAVKAFQKAKGLAITGKVDSRTWAALMSGR